MNEAEFKIRHIVASNIGKILHNKIEAYWYIREKNAGDLVTPTLLKLYGFTPVHSFPENAKLVSCGSLLQRIPEDYSGFILGTGFIRDDSTKKFPKARILAVRGELTRDKLGITYQVVLGDPGILISRILKKRQEKQYTLGIVPHFLDKNDARLSRFYIKNKKEVLFINIQQDPLTVLKEIDKCNYVLSSSLHGLVFADSLKIPNIWMIISDQVAGKGFKFNDYNSALKKRQTPLDLSGDETLSYVISQNSTPSDSILEEVKQNLDKAYCLFKEEIS
jgi:pyruvyltransferase